MRNIETIFIFQLGILLLSGCANKKLDKSLLESREEGHNCFVQTKDRLHDTEKVTEIRGRNGITKLKLSDGTKIDAKDVIAYQTPGMYCRRVSDRMEDHFAKRVIKGRICFYTIYVSGSVSAKMNANTGLRETGMDELQRYVQKDNGFMYDFDYKTLHQLVSDYQPVLAHLETYSKTPNTKKRQLMWDVMIEYNKAVKDGLVK